jgi:tricorn protease
MGTEQGAYLDRIDGPRARALRKGSATEMLDTQGGDTGQLVAEKLAQRIIGWNVSRYEEPSSYPAEAPRGPIVAITDEYASYGGDIVIQALKSYGIATVVGTVPGAA